MILGALDDDALFTIVFTGFVVFVLFKLLMIRMSAQAVVVATILGALAGVIVGYSLGESDRSVRLHFRRMHRAFRWTA